jgi:hypothetical protein
VDDAREVARGVAKFSYYIACLISMCQLKEDHDKERQSGKLTLSHQSNAHNPAYNATAHELALVLVPSNHPVVFQS